MTTSAPYQNAFVQAALDPELPAPDGLSAPDGGDAGPRFRVYRNNVIASLIEALGAAYPAVKALVGEAFFDAAAGRFVRANPPRTPLMILYGEGFADWLAAFEPAQRLPYLPDVARIDRARLEATNAADAPAPTAEAAQASVSGVDPEAVLALRLTPHPSVRVVASQHPAFSIWRKALGDPAISAIAARPETALTVRPEESVRTTALPDGGGAFLRAASEGASLGEAAERAAAGGADVGAILAACLAARAFTEIAPG